MCRKAASPSPPQLAHLMEARDPHEPLLGRWLIQIALHFGWHIKPGRVTLPDVLENERFLKLTGFELPLKRDEDGDPVIASVRRLSNEKIETLLLEQADRLRASISGHLPLLERTRMLAALFGFNRTEEEILSFVVAMEVFSSFRRAVRSMNQETSHQQLVSLLAQVLELSVDEISMALQPRGALRSSGIVRLDTDSVDLEQKFELIGRLGSVLMAPDTQAETIVSLFLRQAAPASLTLGAFPHLAQDIESVCPYLRAVVRSGEQGANLLFYGPPGTGKTELAKALAADLGMTLYEVAYANEDGDPIYGIQRLRAYSLCQRVMAKMPDALLMFDEVEDVLPTAPSGVLAMLGIEEDASPANGKAWINRILERNARPAIWITNNVTFDPAYLRRFDYSVRLPIPPEAVRTVIAQHHFREFNPPERWIRKVASNDATSPGQLERAARMARLGWDGNPERAMALADRALDRSARLLGQKVPVKASQYTAYDRQFINADVAVDRLVMGLRRSPAGTFCFYGPPGTGKSEFGRHLAAEVGKPALLRRASDILSMWVGQTEKLIAQMFADAGRQEAVLILDEADSFLADRKSAANQWEVTQINELLTQMEAFEGIFICTTNLMDRLDPASLRRFTFKVKFDYLSADQREGMFHRELSRMKSGSITSDETTRRIRTLERLTPGDFAAVSRQFTLWGTEPTAEEFIERLEKEVLMKGGGVGRMGFVR